MATTSSKMPLGLGKSKDEVWNMVLVEFESTLQHTRAAKSLGDLAEKQHYSGHWYIKRLEGLEQLGKPQDRPYTLLAAVKAENQAAMNKALDALKKTLPRAAGLRFDVYVVSPLFRSNW